ncbi:DGQHR domain-containing protein [Shouchella sp. 1P09AA]|uniref:DGQHR domain-containing protein n=1 Tax=unclassified Shouchella TaxID=2893065 RepID=UPI0039A11B0F
MAKNIVVPAIECKQNNNTFYTTIMTSDDLKEVCFITRRNEDNDKGFQRLLNKSRAKDIARYLDEKKGTIPSSIILSAQNNVRITFDDDDSELIFPRVKDSFLVIDGQHRLFGLFESSKNYKIPVIIFNNLKSSEEVSLFIDINTTQKGVPSALLLDIKQLAGRETKIEEMQRELFDMLNQKRSPMTGLLSASKSASGKISRAAFNEATEVIFKAGPLSEHRDINIVFKGVNNYLTAIEHVFKISKAEGAKLTKATIFKAVFEIFNEVLNRSLQEKGDVKIDSLKEILEPLAVLEYDNYTGSNKATLNRIISDMRYELNKYRESLSEDMF